MRKFRVEDTSNKVAIIWVVGCVAVFALVATANESPLGLVLFASPFVAIMAFSAFWVGVAVLAILEDIYLKLFKKRTKQ